ncbi:MAG: phosphatidylserine decarboxylase [Nannocystaceae bacterium]
MANDIDVYNRYTGAIEQEMVYGEGYLRFVYDNPLGRLLLFALIKRSFFSRLYGWLMSRPGSRRKIEPFIEQYRLDASEFAEPVSAFGTFNEFFTRRLTAAARPICEDEDALVFPADGRHLVFPDLSRAQPAYVKACAFELARFVGSDELARDYEHGSMLICRLAPIDYHRFHFPVSGVAGPVRRIAGDLLSVSPIGLARMTKTFVDNKRWVTTIETERFGRVTFIEVGATAVGSVEHTAGPGPVERGDEKGYFLFGGSTVVVLLEPGRVQWSDDLLEHSARGVELYAKMGDVAGRLAEDDDAG